MDHKRCKWSGNEEMAEPEAMQVPFMEIQPNWDEVIRDPTGKFWISCKKPGERTLHGELRKPSDSTTASGTEKFIITDMSQHSVTVECPQAQCVSTFIHPVETFSFQDKKLLSMDISGSGALGVCSSEDGKLWVWDADTGETRRTLQGHVGDVYTCRYFPSGIVVLSGGADLRLKIWSAQDGSCPRTLTGHTRGISDTAIIDRGKNIISVSSDGTARLWDCGSAKCLATVATVRSPINSCAVAASSLVGEKNTAPPTEPECATSDKLLLLACEDGTLQLCDVRNRNIISSYSGGKSPLTSCAFVTETTILCGAKNGRMSVVDTRKPDQSLQCVSFSGSAVTSLLLLGENRCLAGCGDGSCVVWSLRDPGGRLCRLTGPELDPITSVRKAGGRVYTSCRDGNVRVYQLADMS